MSFCRFSSMDWACQLYCYESAEGFVTHVASNKAIGDIPKAKHLFTKGAVDEYVAAHNAQMKWLETAERRDIELPHAGESFTDATLEYFLARLLELRRIGYVFPDHVLEEVRAEIEQEAKE